MLLNFLAVCDSSTHREKQLGMGGGKQRLGVFPDVTDLAAKSTLFVRNAESTAGYVFR